MRRDDHDEAKFLTDLAQHLHDSSHPAETAQVAFDQLKTMLVDADCASVTIRRRRRTLETLASSSPTAAQADLVQYELRQGPCIQAATSREEAWFRSCDLTRDERWPQWGPKAAALGINSLLSVGLLSEARPFGAINVYSERAGAFVDAEDIDLVLMWAAHLAAALSSAWTQAGLEIAISARHAVGVAQGILMARFDLDAEGAFNYLTRQASTSERKLREVAADIVRAYDRQAT